jgi:DNA-binding CsgD family transcriptional regulator/N-acetylneuraminic acid mutarotase
METNSTSQPILSERELEILKLVATGVTNQQIALDLFISVNTVKVHLRNIFSKLDVESRTEATMYAVREGWIVLEGAPVSAEAEEEPPLPRGRIAGWQRVFFVASALLIALIVFLPPAPTTSIGTDSQFTDRTTGVLGNPQDVASSRWVSKAQMPTSRARLAVVAYQGELYAIGGDTADGVSGAVEVYDPTTDTWTRRANKPWPVRNVAAAVLTDRIYVPGGHDAMDQAISTVEVYDPQADAWSEVAPLPTPLFAYAIAALNGKLYLFGGWDSTRYLDTVFIYDLASDTWAAGTPMGEPRGFCAAAVVGERVYVLGGYDGHTESTLCEVYEPGKEGSEEHPWSSLPPMLMGRGGLAAVAVENYIYAIGGGWTEYLSFNERYDVAQDTWTAFDSPLLGQWRTLGAAAVESKAETVIHVIGGWNDRYQNLSTNYAYSAFWRIYLPSQ